jgi:DME family drug/metabolite transporter
MQTRPVLGIAMVLSAAMLWGTTGTAQSLASGLLDPLWFGSLRLGMATLFFAAFAVATGAARPAGRLPWPGLVVAGLGMAIYNLAFFAGIRQIGVGIGTAIALGSGPVWAGLLEAVWLRRRPSGTWWAGALLAGCGGAMLVAGPGAATGVAAAQGVALCLASGLAYAAYSLVSQKVVAEVGAALATLGTFGTAALIALPAALAWRGTPTVLAADWLAVAYVGVVTAGVAYLLFSQALKHIRAATGVTLALMEPVVAFLLAIAVVGERPGALAWPGLGLLVAGVALVVRDELRGAQVPAAGADSMRST